MKILADATLTHIPYNSFFTYSVYHDAHEMQQTLGDNDILICRSTLKITPQVLKDANIKCIATASSGTDHIDMRYLAENNIQLIDAKGCNANSVANYVMCCIAALRINKYTVGNNIGIIGMGAVGQTVAQQLLATKFKVYGYDPLNPAHNYSCTLQELQACDVLLIHANLHATEPFPSYNLINQDFLQKTKAKIIINAARGNIVNEENLLAHSSIIYCTDVYANEPAINPEIIQYANICTPHIAGHSIDAKYKTMLHLRDCIHHQYGVSLPENTEHTTTMLKIDYTKNWEDQILQIYNPYIETKRLQQATNLQETFLRLRQEHKFRCEFSNIPNYSAP